MINLFFIKTFISVAQTGSFRLAAEKNNITQPAVSQHIRLLEKRLRCVLFERSSKKITLTSDGLIFISYAQQILELYENAKTKISENNNQFTGDIHIISIYTMGLYQLKPIMQHLLKKYPGININLEYGYHDAIYEAIKKRTADFGLVAYPKPMSGCMFKIFAEEEMVLVQSNKHHFFKKRNVQLKELNGISFVGLDSKTPTGAAIHQYLVSKDIQLNLIKESENIETIKNAVDVGIGCSILPKSTVLQEVKNKTFDIIQVKGLDIKRPLAILYSNKKIFSKSTRLFYEMIHKDYSPSK
ncbi:MAG: LysR family transcriptional regulator [Candidatus Omnitrophica bacterium]|nr:LysR family transcriptional regulator [Candidatus Omnitrophota bacterium]